MSRRRPSPTAPIADGPRSVWEQYYADATHESPPGPWLDAHLPADPRTLLAARWRRNPAAGIGAIGAVARVRPRALDLGCGAGHDTAWLLAHGFAVTAIDYSANALALSRRRNPAARHLQSDLRDIGAVVPPVARWHLIVASLSLHYFDKADTLKIFAAIRARLRVGGLFVFRVNAADESGAPSDAATRWTLAATGGGGVSRQYFTEEKIRTALGGLFELRVLGKRLISRYGTSKSLFEVVAA